MLQTGNEAYFLRRYGSFQIKSTRIFNAKNGVSFCRITPLICLAAADGDRFVVLNGALAGVAAIAAPLLDKVSISITTFDQFILPSWL